MNIDWKFAIFSCIQDHPSCDKGLQLNVVAGLPHQSFSSFDYPSASVAGIQIAISVELFDLWGNTATYDIADLNLLVIAEDASGNTHLTTMVILGTAHSPYIGTESKIYLFKLSCVLTVPSKAAQCCPQRTWRCLLI